MRTSLQICQLKKGKAILRSANGWIQLWALVLIISTVSLFCLSQKLGPFAGQPESDILSLKHFIIAIESLFLLLPFIFYEILSIDREQASVTYRKGLQMIQLPISTLTSVDIDFVSLMGGGIRTSADYGWQVGLKFLDSRLGEVIVFRQGTESDAYKLWNEIADMLEVIKVDNIEKS